jgi:hypothetical protein
MRKPLVTLSAVFRYMPKATQFLALFRGPELAENIVLDKVGCGGRI